MFRTVSRNKKDDRFTFVKLNKANFCRGRGDGLVEMVCINNLYSNIA
jgi:hypothetical protein